MDYHQNARTMVWSREEMAKRVIEQGSTLAAACSRRQREPEDRCQMGGALSGAGPGRLADRSCRPLRLRRPTKPELAERVELLRRQRWTGLRIAQATGLSRATVSRILRRRKLSRIRDLEPRPPVLRYEHAAPGDLLHLDIKKLGRIAKPGHRVTGNLADRTRRVGWEYVHVAIDDHSRIAFSAIFPDETAASTVAFLCQAVAYYARLGIRFRGLLTDNGPAYRSRRFAKVCRELGINIVSPGPTPRAPTAKPNASSALLYRNGPMPAFIRTPMNAAPSFALDTRIQLAQTSRQSQPLHSHQQSRRRSEQSVDTTHLVPAFLTTVH